MAAAKPASRPRFFRTAAEFREWLRKHGEKESELWMGYFKKASGKGGLTYQDALDEALCFGWIDGIVKTIDEESYMQRWTPRKKGSHWSNVNIRKVAALEAAGRMDARGRAVFAQRDPARIGRASYEQPERQFPPDQLQRLKANRKAWEHFSSQPPGYQRLAKHWVTSAKQEATREKRFKLLIESATKGKRPPGFI